MKKALILAAVLFMAAGCSTKPEVSNEEKFLNHFKGYDSAATISPPGAEFLSISENGRRLSTIIASTGEVFIFVRAESENSAIYSLNGTETPLVFTSATEFTLSGTAWIFILPSPQLRANSTQAICDIYTKGFKEAFQK